MVYAVSNTSIRVCSQGINDWMDCIFVVNKPDYQKAVEVLATAWDSFWDEENDTPYGDWLEQAMKDAGISYEVFFKQEEDE